MKTTKICFAVAATLTVSAIPAHAVGLASAPPDYSAVFGGPSWTQPTTPAPGITLRPELGDDTPTPARRDPTWPETSPVLPAIPLEVYVAPDPQPAILNDGPRQTVRSYAILGARPWHADRN